jgi:hypothetical protein
MAFGVVLNAIEFVLNGAIALSTHSPEFGACERVHLGHPEPSPFSGIAKWARNQGGLVLSRGVVGL